MVKNLLDHDFHCKLQVHNLGTRIQSGFWHISLEFIPTPLAISEGLPRSDVVWLGFSSLQF